METGYCSHSLQTKTLSLRLAPLFRLNLYPTLQTSNHTSSPAPFFKPGCHMELPGASGPSQQHPAAPTSSSWARKSTPSKLAPKGGRAGFSGIATAQHTTHKQASHFWVNIQAVAVTNAVNKVQKSLDKVLYIASKQAIWPNLYPTLQTSNHTSSPAPFSKPGCHMELQGASGPSQQHPAAPTSK